jgi:uncharacterized protein (TIGR02996 family)
MAKKRLPPQPVQPALLAAVLADPDDDAARQALADALQERGDPRGEFIAVQLALAHEGARETAETKALWDRFRELHSAHSAKWAKPLRALGKKTRWEFHRGFARQLRLGDGPKAALELVAAALAVEPVTHLVMQGQSIEWACTLLAVPGMARLRRLCILTTQDALDLANVFATTELPHLGELRVGIFRDADVEALSQCKLPALRHLAIGAVRLSEVALARLLRSPAGRQLHTLEIGRCEITPPMCELVIASQLTRFSASTGWVDAVEPALRARFGDQLVIERDGGFDYLLDGVTGLSKITLSGRA